MNKNFLEQNDLGGEEDEKDEYQNYLNEKSHKEQSYDPAKNFSSKISAD